MNWTFYFSHFTESESESESELDRSQIMTFMSDSDSFLTNLLANSSKIFTKQQKTTFAQLIISLSDLLGSQNIRRSSQKTILKFKKQRAVASLDKPHEKLAKLHKTHKMHENQTNFKTSPQTSQEMHEN